MVIGSVIVPHPPIAVKEVGKGEEKKMEKTLAGFSSVSKFIKSLKPDLLVFLSPHAVSYQDYFNVSKNDSAFGNLQAFQAGQVSFKVRYDQAFTSRLEEYCKEKNFPCGCEYDQQILLDHGVMVPYYFFQQEGIDLPMVRIGLSGLSLPMHYRLGEILNEVSNELNKRVVLVSSGDLSHCLKQDGPYGYAKEGELYDEKIQQDLASGDFERLLQYERSFLDQAMVCGHKSFTIMAGCFDGYDVSSKIYSYEAPFGVGYMTASFLRQDENPKRHFLDLFYQHQEEKLKASSITDDPYVSLAKEAISTFISKNEILDHRLYESQEGFKKRKGVFVSIHKNGMLRGCIGTIFPTCDSVAEEIIQNAISACSKDPRFNKVQLEELPYLNISVDVLEESESVTSMEELDPEVYGVIVKCDDGRVGVLLPQLEGIDTPMKQIRIACSKANINMKQDPFYVERFQVVRHV